MAEESITIQRAQLDLLLTRNEEQRQALQKIIAGVEVIGPLVANLDGANIMNLVTSIPRLITKVQSTPEVLNLFSPEFLTHIKQISGYEIS